MMKQEDASAETQIKDPLEARVNYVLLLSARQLDEVRQIAEKTDVSIQSLFREGIDLMLAKRKRFGGHTLSKRKA